MLSLLTKKQVKDAQTTAHEYRHIDTEQRVLVVVAARNCLGERDSRQLSLTIGNLNLVDETHQQILLNQF